MTTGDMNTMSDFSSAGPTLDGRIKPDVIAPGQWVSFSFMYGRCCRCYRRRESYVQYSTTNHLKYAANTLYTPDRLALEA